MRPRVHQIRPAGTEFYGTIDVALRFIKYSKDRFPKPNTFPTAVETLRECCRVSRDTILPKTKKPMSSVYCTDSMDDYGSRIGFIEICIR